ncbi:uncharacterized protein HKW66_Vig0077860 [Vigna angularis]|uniref:Ycf20-like protein n=1 Tax=Phaseolus angularis TaxID=3914 RepID=A0A8T0K6H4_PHAAN|nr:uncharacterized protein HKW66_Vig0077860 [Vigna angularis]
MVLLKEARALEYWIVSISLVRPHLFLLSWALSSFSNATPTLGLCFTTCYVHDISYCSIFPIHISSVGLRIRAVQENGGPRRLVDIIRRVPEFSRNYFRSPSRRALFGGISLLGGFYVAQTISLSFGALGVNDVIAAVLCVLLTEYVTKFYYSRPKVTFPVALLNNFKMGFTYGLFIDAFKLAS